MGSYGLEGKTALVTGASSGLGRHFATVLCKAGARVVVAARRVEQLNTLARELEQMGGQAVAAEMDVTSSASVTGAIERAWSDAGPISIVLNNAGAAATRRMLDQDESEWRAVVDTNLVGAANVTRAVARNMVEGGVRGSIINIASILGLYGAVGVSAYAASKAGLLSLTKSLALELGPRGIRVNAIAPGYVRTDLSKDFFEAKAEKLRERIPLGRFLEPADLDGALLLLASDASNAITGATIVVDAGHSLVYEAE